MIRKAPLYYPHHELRGIHPCNLGVDTYGEYGEMPLPLLQYIKWDIVHYDFQAN